jgi:hypothetical protein
LLLIVRVCIGICSVYIPRRWQGKACARYRRGWIREGRNLPGSREVWGSCSSFGKDDHGHQRPGRTRACRSCPWT